MNRLCDLGIKAIFFWTILLVTSFSLAEESKASMGISYFEKEEDIAKWVSANGAVIERSSEHATQGKYSAEITFQPYNIKKDQNIMLPKGNLPSTDWSEYGMFTIDFYNPNDFNIIFSFSAEPGVSGDTLVIAPSTGYTYRRSLLLPFLHICTEEEWFNKTANITDIKILPDYEDYKLWPEWETESMPKDKEVRLFIDNIQLLTKKETVKAINSLSPIEPKEPFLPKPTISKKPPFLESILKPFYFKDKGLSLKVLINNKPNSEEVKVNLKIELKKEDKLVKEFLKKELIIKAKEKKEIKDNFSLKEIKEGYSTLTVSLYKDGRVIDRIKRETRIYSHQWDFSYVPSDWSEPGYGASIMFSDPLWKEHDFFRLSYGPIEYISIINNMVPIIEPSHLGRWGLRGERIPESQKTPLKSAILPKLEKLAEDGIPFYMVLLAPHGMWFEPYEILMDRVGACVDLAEKICKEDFMGIIAFEVEGMAGMPVVSKEKTRLDKADAFIKLIRKIKDDVNLPSDKKFMLMGGTLAEAGLYYEGGADIRWHETPDGIYGSFSHELSQIRGLARSFNKEWGITERPDHVTHAHTHDFFHYNITTGRYDPEMKKDDPRKWTWTLEDCYKNVLEKYYSGTNYLEMCYEFPLVPGKLTENGEMILKFLDFADNNPRAEDVISKVAIVRSKGDYWSTLVAESLEEASGGPGGLGAWTGPDKSPYKEEADFIYLNNFYPNLTDDMVLAKHFWTGTSYGAVDIIYPSMKLEDMKNYNCIIFLGYHRMDSVRKDFLDDLMEYVKGGGTVLLSIDQLRDSQNKLDIEKLEKFLGATSGSKFFPGTLIKKKKIKGYIEVVEDTPFKINKKRYPISSKLQLWHEKEPWVYKVIPEEARVVAVDSQGIPALLLNKYGKGYVLLFTSPTLSMIPGEKGIKFEQSGFVEDVIDKVCSYKPLPVNISPEYENIEFLIAKTEDRGATIFVMNHGPEDWKGDIIVNLNEAGLSKEIGDKISCKISKGYKIEEIKPEVIRKGDDLIIKGIFLQGDREGFLPLHPLNASFSNDHFYQSAKPEDKEGFCAYRQASFAYLRLGEKQVRKSN